jgi:hypothetical protein
MGFPFNWPGQDQDQLRKPGDDWLAGWNGMWGDIGKKMFQSGDDKLAEFHNSDSYKQRIAELNRSEGQPEAAPNVRQGANPTANISRILGLDQPVNDPYPSHGYSTDGSKQANDPTMGVDVSEDEMRAQKIRDLMAELEQNGAGAENLAMVDQAFAGSLSAIQNARNSAQKNYQESDKAIQGLTAGHVNEIKTKDRQAVESNANELSGAYNKSFGDAKNSLVADQQREQSARAEMLQRLGIQEAGMGDAGSAQSQAITRLTEDNAARQGQAATYKAADLTRNTELASSQASAGIERQGDLRKQLNGINANLDQSQASVENSKAQAKLSAQNADKADFLKQLQFYSDELRNIKQDSDKKEQTSYDRAIDQRDFNAKNSGHVGGVFDVANQKISSIGNDPTPYQQAYAQTMEENQFDSRSGQDKVGYFLQQMRRKNPNLDPQVALDYITTIENFGTDKANTRLAG